MAGSVHVVSYMLTSDSRQGEEDGKHLALMLVGPICAEALPESV